MDIWTDCDALWENGNGPNPHERRTIQSFYRHLEQCRQFGGFARRSLYLRPFRNRRRLRSGRMEPWSSSAATRAALATRESPLGSTTQPLAFGAPAPTYQRCADPTGPLNATLPMLRRRSCRTGTSYFAAETGYGEAPSHFFEFTTLNAINQVADDFYASSIPGFEYSFSSCPTARFSPP